jgi:polyhydroxybutyrate depolymerase
MTAAPSLKVGDHTVEINVDGQSRNYLVHIPKQPKPRTGWPVVLVFHGGGIDAARMLQFCGMNDKSDEAGFVVVYPNGSGRLKKVLTFNGGNCCGYAQRNNIDDVKFVDTLLDDLQQKLPLDKRRVYATGMSNGAIMSYLLASKLSHRIAAIAPVAGPMGTEECSPKRAVPVCHFHGVDDRNAPFDGGIGPRSLTKTVFHSVDHSIHKWIQANGCRKVPTITQMPTKTDDGTKVTRYIYGGGKHNTEVVLYKIAGGGHTWPGHSSPIKKLGVTTMNIDANDIMWDFFKRHRLGERTDCG